MNLAEAWDALETLDEAPLFPIQAPDGKKHLTELNRVVQFRRIVRTLGPSILLFANANAGKRNPLQASREGLLAGVFDYTMLWQGGAAMCEFNGYSRDGRPGKLSRAQIEFGNKVVRAGHKAAMFFDPVEAVAWLRSIGAPIRAVV